jgi:hypothetical protein
MTSLDADGIVTRTVPLGEWCRVELINRNTAYKLIRQGILPAHKKSPLLGRSPYLVSPEAHRAYRRNARRASGVVA